MLTADQTTFLRSSCQLARSSEGSRELLGSEAVCAEMNLALQHSSQAWNSSSLGSHSCPRTSCSGIRALPYDFLAWYMSDPAVTQLDPAPLRMGFHEQNWTPPDILVRYVALFSEDSDNPSLAHHVSLADPLLPIDPVPEVRPSLTVLATPDYVCKRASVAEMRLQACSVPSPSILPGVERALLSYPAKPAKLIQHREAHPGHRGGNSPAPRTPYALRICQYTRSLWGQRAWRAP